MNIARLLWRRILDQDVSGMSAALCYRTLFALIPTLVLAFLVLQSLGVTRDVRQDVHRLLESAGFAEIAITQPASEAATAEANAPPATGSSDEQGVERLSEKLEELILNIQQKLTVGALGPISVLLLIWAAVGLLTAVETSLNRVFEATSSRSHLRRLVLYWSVITLVPIAVAAAFTLAGKLVGMLESNAAVSGLGKVIIYLFPIAISMLLLALVYMLMPNTRVPFRYALLAAVLAVPLWAGAEKLFAIYVQRVAHNSLYGTLGLIPLFLVWLNVCWLIFLCAAQHAYVAANLALLERRAAASRLVLGAWDVLAAAIAIAKPFQAGAGPVARESLTTSLNVSEVEAQALIDRLCTSNIICPVQGAEESYVLARPAERIAVRDVLVAASPAAATAVPSGVAAGGPAAAAEHPRWSPAIVAAIAVVETRADEVLARLTLADVAGGNPEQPPPGKA